MATTKKTSSAKKSKTTKSTKNAKSANTRWSWRFSFIAIGINLIIIATIVLFSFVAANYITAQNNQARLDRINGIYTSLKLDDTYVPQRSNVFGDKRVYPYDKGRTFSSEIDYLHADTVSNTVQALDAKIKAAGFKFIDEPYPGTAETQYHYKNDQGQYIRLTVSSKPYDDASQNAFLMDKNSVASLRDKYDTNAGPANIIIKVNLDDNNE